MMNLIDGTRSVIDGLLAAFGLHKAAIVFGAIGAALSSVQGKERTRVERVINFIGGLAISGVGTAFVTSHFGIKPEDAGVFGAIGFMFGYFGMALMDAFQVAVKALKDVGWQSIVDSWLRKPGGGS